MAALQHTPIAFQSKPISQKPTLKTHFLSTSISNPTTSTNFLSLTLKTPTLRLRRHGGSGLGARMSSSAASSYATALADLANSNNTLDTTSADVEKIEKIFDEQVLKFFSNPTVEIEKKREVVDELGTSSGLQPHTVNFLNILIDAQRINLVKEIVKEFEIVYNGLTGTELAVVSSVVNLESQHLAQIAKQVQKLTEAQNVRIKTVIDPSLVAGFTVRYGNSGSKLIDMSVKKQLEEIAAQIDLGDITLAV